MKTLKPVWRGVNESFLALLVVLFGFWILTLVLSLFKAFATQFSIIGPKLIFSNPLLVIAYILAIYYLWKFYSRFQSDRAYTDGRRNYSIRPILPTDEAVLWEMLYQSFYTFPSEAVKLGQILEPLEVSQYLEDWGKLDDYGFIAFDVRNGQPLGAAWFRLLAGDEKGYGYVDDHTPELMLAIRPKYQHLVIEIALLNHLLATAKKRFSSLSVHVSPHQPGWVSCPIMGFKAVSQAGTALIMQKDLHTEQQVDASNLIQATKAGTHEKWPLKR